MKDERTIDATDEGLERPVGGEETDGPFVDAVFAALADWRRRELLGYFRDTDATTATVDELALLIGAYEPDGTGGQSRPHEEIVEELLERHLPRLTAVSVVEYDYRSETVRYQGQPTVEKWLEHVRAIDGRERGDAIQG